MFISQGPPGSLQAHTLTHTHALTKRKIYAVSLVTFIGWEVLCVFPPPNIFSHSLSAKGPHSSVCVCACACDWVCVSRLRRRLVLHLSLSSQRRLNFSPNPSSSRLEGQTRPLTPVRLCRSLLLRLPSNFRLCQPRHFVCCTLRLFSSPRLLFHSKTKRKKTEDVVVWRVTGAKWRLLALGN